MAENIFYPKEGTNPFIKDLDEYKGLYQQSIDNPSEFFGNLAKENIQWIEEFDTVHNGEFSETKWFEGGKTNISVNCIDRHLKNNANKTAIIWEGDDPDDSKQLSYQELHDEVCKFANVLKGLGVKKGSRVCIYMPMIVEVAYAMLEIGRAHVRTPVTS